MLADTAWFEGTWIWSRERSIDLWSQGDPAIAADLEEVAPDVVEIWVVDSGTLKVIADGEAFGPENYFVRPISDVEFEVIHEIPIGKLHHNIVQRTEFGFCIRRGGDYVEEPFTKERGTCFVPHDI